MTQTRNTPASGADLFEGALGAPADLDERSRRARTEEMGVFPLGNGQYAVESQSGNEYVVDVTDGRCTCPDHAIRGARCKHMRRVALEITTKRVVPPEYVPSTCASCGEFALVPPGEREPHLCETHRLAPGERAIDRETGDLVLVVSVSGRRADEVSIPDTDQTVADYATNDGYPDSDPVACAVYPSVRVDDEGPHPGELRVYSFPLSRLERVADEPRDRRQ